jgi:hypothetical protein
MVGWKARSVWPTLLAACGTRGSTHILAHVHAHAHEHEHEHARKQYMPAAYLSRGRRQKLNEQTGLAAVMLHAGAAQTVGRHNKLGCSIAGLYLIFGAMLLPGDADCMCCTLQMRL